MGCPTGLVTAVAAVITSPGALLTPASKMALFGRIPRAGGVTIITHPCKRTKPCCSLLAARLHCRRGVSQYRCSGVTYARERLAGAWASLD